MDGEVDFLRIIWVVVGARMETGLEGWAVGAKSSWWVQDKDLAWVGHKVDTHPWVTPGMEINEGGKWGKSCPKGRGWGQGEGPILMSTLPSLLVRSAQSRWFGLPPSSLLYPRTSTPCRTCVPHRPAGPLRDDRALGASRVDWTSLGP